MKPIFKHKQSQHVEYWRLKTATARRDILMIATDTFFQYLPSKQHRTARRVFDRVLHQAKALDAVISMDGATGESNELRRTARGKAMIVGMPSAQQSDNFAMLLMAQALSALLAGCEVILRCAPNDELSTQIQTALTQAGVPKSVIDVANDADLNTLLHMSQLAAVGLIGDQHAIQEVASTLAQTDGMLTKLVPVTDLEGGQEIFAPDFVFGYSTERVKTINTTAIGGNASLIELGMG